MAAMGMVTWVMAVAVITMVGAEAIIAVDDDRLGRTNLRGAASIGGLFLCIYVLTDRNPFSRNNSNQPLASISLRSLLKRGTLFGRC